MVVKSIDLKTEMQIKKLRKKGYSYKKISDIVGFGYPSIWKYFNKPHSKQRLKRLVLQKQIEELKVGLKQDCKI